jgi:hypothetical protein
MAAVVFWSIVGIALIIAGMTDPYLKAHLHNKATPTTLPNNGPYRSSEYKEQQPTVKIPFSKRFPMMWKALRELKFFGTGIGIVGGGLGVIWCLFPGLYRLGILVGNSKYLNWGLSTKPTCVNYTDGTTACGYGYALEGWGTGLLTVAAPFILFGVLVLIRFIGLSILRNTKFEKDKREILR